MAADIYLTFVYVILGVFFECSIAVLFDLQINDNILGKYMTYRRLSFLDFIIARFKAGTLWIAGNRNHTVSIC